MAEALTNQAHEYLYRKIISCEYLPGQELNEKQLLEETSFGRTPLRAADAAKRKSYRYLSTQRNAYQSIYRKKDQ